MSLKHQFDIFLEHLVANLMLLQGSFFFFMSVSSYHILS